jgi:hypothetical protein
MSKVTKAELAGVLEYLVSTDDNERVNEWLNLLEPVIDAGLEITIGGEAQALGPLLRLRKQSIDTYAKLINAVDTDRAAQGREPLGFRRGKAAYLADFMAEKRKREGRLLAAWNLQFAERDRLRLDARKEFVARHAAVWFAEKQKRMEALRVRLGRTLTRAEQRVVITEVDAEVDDEIDQLEGYVNSEIRKPLAQRNPNGFKFKVGIK